MKAKRQVRIKRYVSNGVGDIPNRTPVLEIQNTRLHGQDSPSPPLDIKQV